MARKRNDSRYADSDPRTRAHMDAALAYLEEQYGSVSAEWLSTLDMMALNLDLIFRAKDTVMDEGVLVNNRFGGTERHPLIKTIMDAQSQLHKCVAQLGCGPLAKGKVTKNEKESETVAQERLLDKILN